MVKNNIDRLSPEQQLFVLERALEQYQNKKDDFYLCVTVGRVIRDEVLEDDLALPRYLSFSHYVEHLYPELHRQIFNSDDKIDERLVTASTWFLDEKFESLEAEQAEIIRVKIRFLEREIKRLKNQ